MNKLNVVLLVITLLSGIGAVTVQDYSRRHFIALDKAQKQEIQLEQEFARLKLKQAKLSNHQLIKEAAERQNLHPPGVTDTKIIEIKP
ncbi:cell division protein FtsL [Neisseria sp. S1]|uniref:cell division protein FtsL n=1 Tax=Neisseria sp. S1 TaxID=3318354 RepID=UPI003A8A0481